MQHYKKNTTFPSTRNTILKPDFIQKAKFNWIGPKQVTIMEATNQTSTWQQLIYQIVPPNNTKHGCGTELGCLTHQPIALVLSLQANRAEFQ